MQRVDSTSTKHQRVSTNLFPEKILLSQAFHTPKDFSYPSPERIFSSPEEIVFLAFSSPKRLFEADKIGII
jgi:hypothetical protein